MWLTTYRNTGETELACRRLNGREEYFVVNVIRYLQSVQGFSVLMLSVNDSKDP